MSDASKRFAPGVPDEAYARGEVPMTKREVRAITIAYAELAPTDRVLDIGAGTGGLTVDLARSVPRGEVVAVERGEEALALLRTNIDALVDGNVVVVAGEAPAALASVGGAFDAVAIGGHGGALTDMLDAILPLLEDGGRVVLNLIGLSAAVEAYTALGGEPWQDRSLTQVAVAKAGTLGQWSDVRLVPSNPVFVVHARKGEARP